MLPVDLHNLGHVEVKLGKIDEAEKHFNECEGLAGEQNDSEMILKKQDRILRNQERSLQGITSNFQ